MNEEQFDPLVSSWLKQENHPPSDPTASVRTAMNAATKTRQLSRWRWLPPFVHRMPVPPSEPDAVAETDDYEPDRIPATNGHTPTALGRTSSMLSPAKAITAGALVFAIGGVLLIAQPFDQQPTVPGAETGDVAATWLTGTVQAASSCSDGDTEVDIDVIRSRNVECSPQAWTSSDPRFTGDVSRRWSEDTYRMDDGSGSKSVSVDAAYLRNEGGGWTCVNRSLFDGSGPSAIAVTPPVFTHTCFGDGGYDGLSAILVLEPTVGYNEEFVGLIFSGDFPPVPEPPAAE